MELRQKIRQFTITYDKPAYFAGEVMQATVTLVTTGPIQCRGVRANVRGEGFAVIGLDAKDRKTHRSTYWKETHTLWGPFHRTEEIDEAGENAIFGSPWAPNEGVLHFPIQSATEPLVVRVMDEDYGKRDDLLGEVLIANPERLVEESQSGAREVTLPLNLKGKPVKHKGTASILVIRAAWVQLPGASTPRQLRIECCRALHLRKADWGVFAKNDVYVQAYHPPPGSAVDASKPLPKPEAKSTLPPGEHTFVLPPLKLPDNLPASREQGGTSYVRYYIAANIDIPWHIDPITRAAFSVAPRLSADVIKNTQVQIRDVSKKVYPNCYLPPFCCMYQCACFELTSLEAKGEVTLSGSIDRLHGAPGEAIGVSATVSNSLDKPVKLVVRMMCWATIYAGGTSGTVRYPYLDRENYDWSRGNRGVPLELLQKGKPLLSISIPPGAQNFQVEHQHAVIPKLEASYHGGYLVNEAWTQVLNQYGMRNERYWRRKRMDALTWGYQLVLELNIPESKFDLTKVFPFIVCSIPRASSIQPTIVVDAVPCPIVDDAMVGDGPAAAAFQSWYREQLPLEAMAAVPVTAVLAPDADTGQPLFEFQPMPTTPKSNGGTQYEYDGAMPGQARGTVLANTYQPMIPVAIPTGPSRLPHGSQESPSPSIPVAFPIDGTSGVHGGGVMVYGSNVPLCAGSVPSNEVMTGRV
jgi:hypothetical protein